MKKIIFYIALIATSATLFSSCKSDDRDTFDYGYSAARFPGAASWEYTDFPGYSSSDQLFYTTFSFLSDPFAQEKELLIPVVVQGNTADFQREVTVKVNADNTTATEADYTIGSGYILSGELYGYVSVIIKNRDDALTLGLEIADSKDLRKGSPSYTKAVISWSNSVTMPTASWPKRYYNLLLSTGVAATSTSVVAYSPAGHRVILAATGWSELPNDRGMIYSLGTYTAYAAIVADYIADYNAANPNAPLLHDAGSLIGQPIVARTY